MNSTNVSLGLSARSSFALPWKPTDPPWTVLLAAAIVPDPPVCFCKTSLSAASAFCLAISSSRSYALLCVSFTPVSHSSIPPRIDSFTTIASICERVTARYNRDRVSSRSPVSVLRGASSPTPITIRRSSPSKLASSSTTMVSHVLTRFLLTIDAASLALTIAKRRPIFPKRFDEAAASICSAVKSTGLKPSRNDWSGTRMARRSVSRRPGKVVVMCSIPHSTRSA